MNLSPTIQVYLQGRLLIEDARDGYRIVPDDEHFVGCIHFKNNLVAPGSTFSILEVDQWNGGFLRRHDFEVPGHDPMNPAPNALRAEEAYINLDAALTKTTEYVRSIHAPG